MRSPRTNRSPCSSTSSDSSRHCGWIVASPRRRLRRPRAPLRLRMTLTALCSLLSAATMAAGAVAETARPAAAEAAAPAAPDPYLYLAQIRSARALDWVRKQNARTAQVIERDPRYARIRLQLLSVLDAQDRIPTGSVEQQW